MIVLDNFKAALYLSGWHLHLEGVCASHLCACATAALWVKLLRVAPVVPWIHLGTPVSVLIFPYNSVWKVQPEGFQVGSMLMVSCYNGNSPLFNKAAELPIVALKATTDFSLSLKMTQDVHIYIFIHFALQLWTWSHCCRGPPRLFKPAGHISCLGRLRIRPVRC